MRGFSLVEIMVATVLLASMGLVLYTSLNSSIKAKDTIEEISKINNLARAALSRMAQEISMAYLSKNYHKSDASYVTQFKGYHDKLFFSAFGNIVRQKDQKQSDQQVLGYFISTDKHGKSALMRKYHPNLNLDVEKEGINQVLVPYASKIEFLYYDDKNNKWDEKWVSDPLSQIGQWIPSDKADKNKQDEPKNWRLPKLVKIVLTIKMPNEEEVKWLTSAEIQVQKPLD